MFISGKPQSPVSGSPYSLCTLLIPGEKSNNLSLLASQAAERQIIPVELNAI